MAKAGKSAPAELAGIGEAALRAIERGIPVFPLVPGGKRPLTPRGFRDATVERSTVEFWWGKAHPAANLGMPTGRPSGTFVLDFDVKPDKGVDGRVSLAAIEAEVGALPQTLTVATASGGEHRWYKWDERLAAASIRAGALGPGIDWRGEGGYVVVPPSRLGDGRTWSWGTLTEMAELSDAWVARILAASLAKGAKRSRAGSTRRGKFPEGQRNEELFTRACAMRAHGWDEARILAKLGEMNAERCDPPLGDAELAAIAASAASYPPPRYELTDVGNGDRYRDQHLPRARHCFELRSWYVWDGARWKQDAGGGRADGLAKEIPPLIYEEALAANGGQQAALERWAVGSQSAGRIRAMVDLARSDMRVDYSELDADGHLLNLPNGVLDLRSLELRPHDPAGMLTRMGGTPWDPAARCPVWEGVLERVLPDPELRAFLRRAVGYSLVAGQDAKALFLVYGPKDSGKSTVMDAVRRMLGDYADSTGFGTFAQDRTSDANTPGLAMLPGLRLVLVSEVPMAARFATGLVKQWTGGDQLTATQKYALPVRFFPTAKLWFVGNDRPRIPRGDEAAWRRVHVVPFEHSIPRDAQDPKLRDRIRLEGVLRWAVDGWLDWAQQRELRPPEAARAARAEYQEDVDPLTDFLSERGTLAPEARERLMDAFRAYASWCREADLRAVPLHEFARALESHGCGVTREGDTAARWVTGLRLHSAQQLPDAF